MNKDILSSCNEDREDSFDDPLELETDCYCGISITISKPCLFCDGKGNLFVKNNHQFKWDK